MFTTNRLLHQQLQRRSSRPFPPTANSVYTHAHNILTKSSTNVNSSALSLHLRRIASQLEIHSTKPTTIKPTTLKHFNVVCYQSKRPLASRISPHTQSRSQNSHPHQRPHSQTSSTDPTSTQSTNKSTTNNFLSRWQQFKKFMPTRQQKPTPQPLYTPQPTYAEKQSARYKAFHRNDGTFLDNFKQASMRLNHLFRSKNIDTHPYGANGNNNSKKNSHQCTNNQKNNNNNSNDPHENHQRSNTKKLLQFLALYYFVVKPLHALNDSDQQNYIHLLNLLNAHEKSASPDSYHILDYYFCSNVPVFTYWDHMHKFWGQEWLSTSPQLILTLQDTPNSIHNDVIALRKFVYHSLLITAKHLDHFTIQFQERKLPLWCYQHPFEDDQFGGLGHKLRQILQVQFSGLLHYFPHMGFMPYTTSHLHYTLRDKYDRIDADRLFVLNDIIHDLQSKLGALAFEVGPGKFFGFQIGSPASNDIIATSIDLISQADALREAVDNLYQVVYNGQIWHNSTQSQQWWDTYQPKSDFSTYITRLDKQLTNNSDEYNELKNYPNKQQELKEYMNQLFYQNRQSPFPDRTSSPQHTPTTTSDSPVFHLSEPVSCSQVLTTNGTIFELVEYTPLRTASIMQTLKRTMMLNGQIVFPSASNGYSTTSNHKYQEIISTNTNSTNNTNNTTLYNLNKISPYSTHDTTNTIKSNLTTMNDALISSYNNIMGYLNVPTLVIPTPRGNPTQQVLFPFHINMAFGASVLQHQRQYDDIVMRKRIEYKTAFDLLHHYREDMSDFPQTAPLTRLQQPRRKHRQLTPFVIKFPESNLTALEPLLTPPLNLCIDLDRLLKKYDLNQNPLCKPEIRTCSHLNAIFPKQSPLRNLVNTPYPSDLIKDQNLAAQLVNYYDPDIKTTQHGLNVVKLTPQQEWAHVSAPLLPRSDYYFVDTFDLIKFYDKRVWEYFAWMVFSIWPHSHYETLKPFSVNNPPPNVITEDDMVLNRNILNPFFAKSLLLLPNIPVHDVNNPYNHQIMMKSSQPIPTKPPRPTKTQSDNKNTWSNWAWSWLGY